MAYSERFARIVPGHVPEMVRVAASLVGIADAEDATQEAILRAWQAWPTLRDESQVRAWLLRITVNVCRQWWRGNFGRHQRTTPLFADDNDALLANLVDDPGTSGNAAALDQRQAVNRLPTDLRVVVVLRYYGDLNASEIADVLTIPSATVRTRLRRALNILRDKLYPASVRQADYSQEGISDA